MAAGRVLLALLLAVALGVPSGALASDGQSLVSGAVSQGASLDATPSLETSPSPDTTPSSDTTPSPDASATPAVPTSLTLEASATCDWRQNVKILGSLTASGAPVAGVQVQLFRAVAAGTYLPYRVLSTAADGSFGTVVLQERVTHYKAVFVGAEGMLRSEARVRILPRARLSTVRFAAKAISPGDVFPVLGYMRPRHARGARSVTVLAFRRESGRWVLRKSIRCVNQDNYSRTRFRGSLSLPYSGTWRLVARHSDWDHAKTTSTPVYVRVTSWKSRYRGVRVGRIKTSKRMVAITFDDGPNRQTSRICDIAEKYGGRVTFFFTGQLIGSGTRGSVSSAYWRGHEIANHTRNHRMLIDSYANCHYQVESTSRIIRSCTGQRPNWVRAGYGGINQTGMRAVSASRALYAHWSIDSYDSHASYMSPQRICSNVVGSIRPGDVILLHQTHPESVRALESICRTLKARGYQMVTLSELAAAGRP